MRGKVQENGSAIEGGVKPLGADPIRHMAPLACASSPTLRPTPQGPDWSLLVGMQITAGEGTLVGNVDDTPTHSGGAKVLPNKCSVE